jgi:DNA segregation ATPase FtsK/SpoIIIE, S-DNA-T family
VVEGETSTLTGTAGLLGLVKGSRAGLALAPDSADGTTVYRTTFPRTSPADRIPGRGLLVRAGRADLVQVALPDES